MQSSHYTYRVTWSEEDQEFVGLCAEFPSLSWLDKDQDQAFKGIRELVKEVISDMGKNGEKIPEPIAKKEYSGKFQVRIPKSVHRDLAIKAAEENISLNRLVNYKLTSSITE